MSLALNPFCTRMRPHCRRTGRSGKGRILTGPGDVQNTWQACLAVNPAAWLTLLRGRETGLRLLDHPEDDSKPKSARGTAEELLEEPVPFRVELRFGVESAAEAPLQHRLFNLRRPEVERLPQGVAAGDHGGVQRASPVRGTVFVRPQPTDPARTG